MQIVIGLIEHLGDIVACEPVARYVRASNSEAHVTWVVSEGFRELIDVNPYIDETLVVGCLTDWIKLVSHNQYDKVIDLHVNFRVCEHCRIPLVKTTGNPFVSVYEWFDYGALLEAFSVGAGLPRLTGQPRVYIGPEHVGAVDALDLPEKFCVVHRESNNTQKDWTDEGWRALSAFIRNELGLDIIEVGAGKWTKPSPLSDGFIDLFNKLPILQTAEVIRRARFFVGIDSGPAHLANAVLTPGVVLLGRHGNFRQYMPFTGFYASPDPAVRIVRNLVGDVRDLTVTEIKEAVRYVAMTSASYVRALNADDDLAGAAAPELKVDVGDRALILESGLFDSNWYSVQYSELIGHDPDPVEHFLVHGLKKRLSPGPDFDTEYYLEMNGDVVEADMNPLVHYIHFGRSEGRSRRRPEPQYEIRDQPGAFAWHGAAHTDPSTPLYSRGFGKSDRPHLLETEYPRTFAFYLPQFHPIVENDWAHGPGFTEWHNVIKTRPLFGGHYQPRVPGELGFYDLRAKDVIEKQVALAKAHGISGFCFYYYYFHGKKLLFDPIKLFLESDIDFPFMFLWANENWSKRWDGGDKEVIIAQQHSREDSLVFLRELAPIFADPRYAKVAGKPILMVYKPHLFANLKETVEIWRQEIERLGFPGIYLVMVDDWTPDLNHPRDLGFDATYEIPANIVPEQVLYSDVAQLGLPTDFTGRIVDYSSFAHFHMSRPFPSYKRFRTVMLPWDNTARYGSRAIVHVNGYGDDYKRWLLQALIDTHGRYEPDERIVFLHSWNEWCEGTYLEPDEKFGRKFLEQTRDAIQTVRDTIDWARNPATDHIFSELFESAREKDAGVYRVFQGLRQQTRYAWAEVERQRANEAELRASLARATKALESYDKRSRLEMLSAVFRRNARSS